MAEFEKTSQPITNCSVGAAFHLVVHFDQTRVAKCKITRQLGYFVALAAVIPDEIEPTFRVERFDRSHGVDKSIARAQCEPAFALRRPAPRGRIALLLQ